MNAELLKLALTMNNILSFAKIPNDDWTKLDAFMKGIEEAGELSEAIMITCGRLPHKELSEEPTGEIADSINQIIDTLSFTTYSGSIGNELQTIHPEIITDSIKKLEPPEHLTLIEFALFDAFESYCDTKHFFNKKPSIAFFNFLIEDLVKINFIITAIEDNRTLSTMQNSFVKANQKLNNALKKKFKKWQAI